jgi:hypothetical protein
MTQYERGQFFDRILALRRAYEARSAADVSLVMSVAAAIEYAEWLAAETAETTVQATSATSASSEQDYANGTGRARRFAAASQRKV